MFSMFLFAFANHVPMSVASYLKPCLTQTLVLFLSFYMYLLAQLRALCQEMLILKFTHTHTHTHARARARAENILDSVFDHEDPQILFVLGIDRRRREYYSNVKWSGGTNSSGYDTISVCQVSTILDIL